MLTGWCSKHIQGVLLPEVYWQLWTSCFDFPLESRVAQDFCLYVFTENNTLTCNRIVWDYWHTDTQPPNPAPPTSHRHTIPQPHSENNWLHGSTEGTCSRFNVPSDQTYKYKKRTQAKSFIILLLQFHWKGLLECSNSKACHTDVRQWKLIESFCCVQLKRNSS